MNHLFENIFNKMKKVLKQIFQKTTMKMLITFVEGNKKNIYILGIIIYITALTVSGYTVIRR